MKLLRQLSAGRNRVPVRFDLEPLRFRSFPPRLAPRRNADILPRPNPFRRNRETASDPTSYVAASCAAVMLFGMSGRSNERDALFSTTNDIVTSMEGPSRTVKKRIPPKFGNLKFARDALSPRPEENHATGSSDPPPISSEKEDCPICKKYSKGPCGDLFKKWLDCTDENPGKDETTGDDLHLRLCQSLSAPLAECLSENEEFYKFAVEEEEPEEDEDLKQAWDVLVRDVEADHNRRRAAFPEGTDPELEIRWENLEGAAWFRTRIKGKDLILAYLRDEDGTLLGAGTYEDMNMGVLRFGVGKATKSVTACALYGEEDGEPLYQVIRRVPRPPDAE